MTDPTNDDRAAWAEAALRTYSGLTGDDFDNALPDLLCDLMHWANRASRDFEDELWRARSFFEEEC